MTVLFRPLTASPSERSALIATLSDQEKVRTGQFRHPADHDRFALGRGYLRRALGEVLDQAPEAIPIAIAPGGRPYVPGGKVDFNLSHAGDWVAIALSLTCPVGIDLEPLNIDPELIDLDAPMLHANERGWLSGVPTERRAEPFLRIWTAKEAIFKSRGVPDIESLAAVSIIDGSSGARRTKITGNVGRIFQELPAPSGYVAALAHGKPDGV